LCAKLGVVGHVIEICNMFYLNFVELLPTIDLNLSSWR